MAEDRDRLAGLLASVAAGDRSGLARVYALTAPKLLAAARRILGSNPAAEDAVQEAFVRIWQRAGDYDPAIASPMAWMTTIARHAAIDIGRKGSERIARASDELDADMSEQLGMAAGPGDPLAADRLATCLGNLDRERRQMVVLAYCYGLSREELSARFDRPVATVKTLLRRGLLALKECLGGG